jgi:hypothetical protein
MLRFVMPKSSVTRKVHSVLPLAEQTDERGVVQQSLFIAIIKRSTKINCVGKLQIS